MIDAGIQRAIQGWTPGLRYRLNYRKGYKDKDTRRDRIQGYRTQVRDTETCRDTGVTG